MHPAINHLAQLPASERLDLVQELWDSIRESRNELSIQEWHRELVKTRLTDLDGHEEERSISRKEVWQQVDERRGS
jgi:putative addiction module component (TIGR02574 family)